jgi:hypothetical protein
MASQKEMPHKPPTLIRYVAPSSSNFFFWAAHNLLSPTILNFILSFSMDLASSGSRSGQVASPIPAWVHLKVSLGWGLHSEGGLPRAAVVGVLGGGQLGQMLAQEAVRSSLLQPAVRVSAGCHQSDAAHNMVAIEEMPYVFLPQLDINVNIPPPQNHCQEEGNEHTRFQVVTASRLEEPRERY